MYLYLPNGAEGYDPSWNTTLCLPQQKDYFHLLLVATQVYWWGSPDLELFCYLIQKTRDFSTVFFQEQHETIPGPFYRKLNNQFGSVTKACHSALPANPTVSSVCIIRWNNIQTSLSFEAVCKTIFLIGSSTEKDKAVLKVQLSGKVRRKEKIIVKRKNSNVTSIPLTSVLTLHSNRIKLEEERNKWEIIPGQRKLNGGSGRVMG